MVDLSRWVSVSHLGIQVSRSSIDLMAGLTVVMLVVFWSLTLQKDLQRSAKERWEKPGLAG